MSKQFIEVNNAHWYRSPTKKDVYYPSSTTILNAFPKDVRFQQYLADSVSWESSQEILKAAGKRGTNVHDATQLLEEGKVLIRESYTAEEWKHLETFVAWYKTTQPVIEAIEHAIASDKLKIGGTIDRVYMIGGKRVLLDIKTSKSIYDSYWAQVASYTKLWEEKNPTKLIDCTAILRLNSRHKCGYEIQMHDRKEIEQDFKVFKAVQDIWNYINPDAKPVIVEVPSTLSLS